MDLRASADIIFAVTPPVFYALYSRLAEFAEKLDPTCRSVIERGAGGLAHAYQAALMQRTALFRQVQRLFDTYDFLVMPTLSAPALRGHAQSLRRAHDRQRRRGDAQVCLVSLHAPVQCHRTRARFLGLFPLE